MKCNYCENIFAGIKYIRAMDTNTVNNKFKNMEQTIKVSAKTDLDLVIECDELCTFVKKENKQWVWLAIDRKTREIVGVHIGDRGIKSASALWQSIPDIYCRYARVYSDYWSAYNSIIPDKQHYSVLNHLIILCDNVFLV